MKNFKLLCILCLVVVFALVPGMPLTAYGQAYTLEKVLVLSRHNIRAPLAGRDSLLGRITPHTWFPWQVNPGELSPRGGALETLMGAYFGQWLEAEGLLSTRETPLPEEVRFYSNSFQRTISTARHFAAGMFPVSDISIEHHYDVNTADPVFLSPIPTDNEAFLRRAEEELRAMEAERSLEERVAKGCALVEQVLDFDRSDYAAQKGIAAFPTNDIRVVIRDGYYTIKGSMDPALRASDALVLQYYEEQDPWKAAFGHALSWEEWTEIARVKAVGVDALYELPTISAVLANPLLKVMGEELALSGRKLTFLCGHDVNLAEVITVLGAENYALPNTIEEKTPIGAKLVIEKRRGEDGAEYARISLIYASTEDLRQRNLLTPDHPPCIFPLQLKGLQANEDGYYSFAEIRQRIDEAIRRGEELGQQ